MRFTAAQAGKLSVIRKTDVKIKGLGLWDSQGVTRGEDLEVKEVADEERVGGNADVVGL